MSPEKKLAQIGYSGLKKLFVVLMAFIGYWQAYEFINETSDLTIYLEESNKIYNKYESMISIKNGSESIIEGDIVEPLTINLNIHIDSLTTSNNSTKLLFEIQDKTITISFDLLNQNEKIDFRIYSKKRPKINSINFRIKNITSTDFYDYEIKKSPFNRIFNFWLIISIVSIILFIDALLVVAKDKELQDIKNFVNNFPLTSSNRKKFTKGYKKVYKSYKVRIKPSHKFMTQIIKNLFRSFPIHTDTDKLFIKSMANFKTEFYIFYRFRTAFLIISPIALLASILALTFNYFYYEIEILNKNLSINFLNKTSLTIILMFSLLIIIFPRRAMNIAFLKKGFRKGF